MKSRQPDELRLSYAVDQRSESVIGLRCKIQTPVLISIYRLTESVFNLVEDFGQKTSTFVMRFVLYFEKVTQSLFAKVLGERLQVSDTISYTT